MIDVGLYKVQIKLQESHVTLSLADPNNYKCTFFVNNIIMTLYVVGYT